MMAVATHGQMDSTVINLKNVVVTGKAGTKSVTAERTRINPSATMSSTTGSVLEVLRSSSAVTIDGSGQVSIRGNGNVLILVDGVPTTLDGLGSIPAANVQSIDIVTSPDAKYDANSITHGKYEYKKKNAGNTAAITRLLRPGIIHLMLVGRQRCGEA